MIKRITNWFIMRRAKNAAGELEANGISLTKVGLIAMALCKAIEAGTAQYGHPFVFPPIVYAVLGTITGIAARDGVDKAAAAKK